MPIIFWIVLATLGGGLLSAALASLFLLLGRERRTRFGWLRRDAMRDAAADALRKYVERAPSFIPALMRLVEICVDGGLEAIMYETQAQLADAYLERGQGAEARVIAIVP